MRFLLITAAIVALSLTTFFLGNTSIVAACIVGGLGFAAILTWVAFS